MTGVFPNAASGYFPSDSQRPDIYFEVVSDGQGGFRKRKAVATNNPALIGAIIIAVLIALIMAIIALMLLIYCFSRDRKSVV